MQYRLFHLDRPEIAGAEVTDAICDAFMGRIDRAVALGIYREVALVDVSDINEVYPLTNYIDEPWTQNEGVLAHAEKVRSTSVGDIVMEADSGLLHSCACIGWEPLTEQQEEAFRSHLGGRIAILEAERDDPRP